MHIFQDHMQCIRIRIQRPPQEDLRHYKKYGIRTVRFSKDNGATWDEIIPVDGLSSVNSYTFTGLTPDTTYTIRAEAIDLSGNIGGISENVTTLA